MDGALWDFRPGVKKSDWVPRESRERSQQAFSEGLQDCFPFAAPSPLPNVILGRVGAGQGVRWRAGAGGGSEGAVRNFSGDRKVF